ncbi:MAG: translation elongation factor Ts [Candidatus Anoxymicrobium japonicum]|uniref:Elongation factor Ts n=1 Tax=Candidatus Anoxymicrobium japonicum TaxID=2013648 RepID=A0A2N3G875_9ACTN|nr:MAG: translation elongation factor Ts [Candidatus Anoxymicrobium japonicum]
MAEGEIKAGQVKDLRARTGVGIMDCKKALAETSGDIEKAVRFLREQGLASAKKRQEKTAEQGIVESYIHLGQQIGVLVEVNCETDFVARNEEFQKLAHLVAIQIAAVNPAYLDRETVPAGVVESELAIYRARCEADGKPEKVWDRIINGMLEKFYGDVCLLEQPFVKDPSLTVGELVARSAAKMGEKIEIRRFIRYQVGENKEKAVG